MKKLLKIAAALVIAASLTACSGKSENRYNSAADAYKSYYDNATSIIDSNSIDSPHEYQYSFDGDQYVGTYKGDWANNAPNGNGTFSGSSSNGDKVTATGTWKSGQLNGQGEVTVDFKTPFMNQDSITFKGEFVNDALNGEGECISYYTDEFIAEYGATKAVTKGQFKNNGATGKVEASNYFNAAFATEYGYDRTVISGTFNGVDDFERPYTIRYYSGSTPVDEIIMGFD